MLSEEQIQKVRLTVASSGWKEVMHPALLARGKAALKALALSPTERAQAGGDFKDADDTLLRAILRECEWMVTCWQNEIIIAEHNRRLEELQAREQNGATAPA